MPQIIHLITTLSRGGAENQLLTLCNASRQGGFAIVVFFLKGKPELAKEFSLIGISSYKLLTGNGLIQLLKNLRNKGAILHAHLPRAEVVATILGLVFRLRVILSKHNAEAFAARLPKTVSRLLAKFVNQNSSDIVFISEAAKEFAILNRELSEDDYSKIHVIHYAIPLIPTKDRKVIDQQKKSQKILKIGTLSRLEPQKNLSILIEACAGLKELGIPFVCEIFGRGKLEEHLRKQILDLDLVESVKLMGFTQDRFTKMAEFDIFVLTSDYEGFGLVLLEAMNVGVPILSSSSDAAIEVLGKNARCLFDLNNPIILRDKLIELYFNESLQKEIVKTYEERLDRFSLHRMFNQMKMLYLK